MTQKRRCNRGECVGCNAREKKEADQAVGGFGAPGTLGVPGAEGLEGAAGALGAAAPPERSFPHFQHFSAVPPFIAPHSHVLSVTLESAGLKHI